MTFYNAQFSKLISAILNGDTSDKQWTLQKKIRRYDGVFQSGKML